MGKKRTQKVVEEKPEIWCYYCDREFEDESILVQHQKAKHFKCDFCHKKLITAGGLIIHCMQVHKEVVRAVPNSKPERSAPEIEIYGMTGIPDELLSESSRLKKKQELNSLQASHQIPMPFGMPMPPMQPQGFAPFPFPGMVPGMHPPDQFGQPANMMGAPRPMFQPPPQFQPPQFQPPPHMSMQQQLPPPPQQYQQFQQAPPQFAVAMQPQINYAQQQQQQQQYAQVADSRERQGAPEQVSFHVSSSPLSATTVAPPPPSVTVTAPPVSDTQLLWTDEIYSMEERRAMLPKYAVAAPVTVIAGGVPGAAQSHSQTHSQLSIGSALHDMLR